MTQEQKEKIKKECSVTEKRIYTASYEHCEGTGDTKEKAVEALITNYDFYDSEIITNDNSSRDET